MFCAVSGQVAEQPVVAGKTGLVYEARVLRKALASNGGRCPVTGTSLDAATDLVEIKCSPLVLPRAPSSQSFPALLSTLQNEWDSVLLEQVALRKELAETRRDLAVALYEREAATGVISRLLQENDERKFKGWGDLGCDDVNECVEAGTLVDVHVDVDAVRRLIRERLQD